MFFPFFSIRHPCQKASRGSRLTNKKEKKRKGPKAQKVSFLGAAAAFSLEERALPSSSANDAKAAQSFFIKKKKQVYYLYQHKQAYDHHDIYQHINYSVFDLSPATTLIVNCLARPPSHQQ